MQGTQTELADDFLADKKKKNAVYFYRKICLLVFAMAMLWQGILLVDNYAKQYYAQLQGSFKMILTLPANTTDEELNKLGEKLRARVGVAAVGVFNSSAALAAVRRQNPQLVDTMLLLGTHKMPAYLEVYPNAKAVAGLQSFTDNLAVQFPQADVHYNAEHARLTANAGLFCKLLRLVEMVALLALLVFMFLVEAAPCRAAHAGAGVFSGVVAAAGACIVGAGVLYLSGHLPEIWNHLFSAKQQVMALVMGGLLGWTLAKWQRF